MPSFSFVTAILVAIVAVAVMTMTTRTSSSYYQRTLFLDTTTTTTTNASLEQQLHEYSNYDVTVVQAPVVSKWWQLTIVARLLTNTPLLGGWIVRKLLERNNITAVIELANAIQLLSLDNDDDTDDGPSSSYEFTTSGKEFGLGEPMVRLSMEEHAWHVQAAAAATATAADNKHLSTDQAAAVVSTDGVDDTGVDTGVDGDNNNNNNNRKKYRTVRDYHTAYQNQQTTPTAVLEQLLDFIQRTNETLRCIEQLQDITILRQAAMASTHRYLEHNKTSLSIWDGVPVLIKSEGDIRGLKTTRGKQWKPTILATAKHHGIIASRFEAAGAIVVGSTVMHELGIQPVGYNPWYGGPQNPYDLARFTGGSSSGSAVAVATGMVPVAIGWDGGGSIRIPAAWSGTTGLAPTYGRIPYAVTSSTSANIISVVKAGPLTGTVQDAAEALLLLGQPLTQKEHRNKHHLYHVLHGGDGVPPPHLKARWEDFNNNDNNNNDKRPPVVVKIGVFPEWVSHRGTGTGKGADDAVYQTFQATLQKLVSKPKNDNNIRYQVVEFKVPYMKLQGMVHGLLISAMFSFIMSRELFADTAGRDGFEFQPATQIQIKLGQQISGLELLACMRIRAFALAQWRKVLTKTADVILTPTTAMTALIRPAGSDVLGFSDVSLFVQMMRFIWPSNLVGMPGLAIPTGVDGQGLPISMQVICKHWHEADCLAVGADMEKLFAHERPMPADNLFLDVLNF